MQRYILTFVASISLLAAPLHNLFEGAASRALREDTMDSAKQIELSRMNEADWKQLPIEMADDAIDDIMRRIQMNRVVKIGI